MRRRGKPRDGAFILLILLLTELCLSIESLSSNTNNDLSKINSGIEAKKWDFRGHSINYEIVKWDEENERENSSPILLLNGFGVGSFHQHRLMSEMKNNHDVQRPIYAMDYLGQGKSWPIDCDDGKSPNEIGLLYSADTWVDQIIQFLEEIVLSKKKKVHLVGNSVGGHLAVVVASKRPDLVESICLLNATPVWGLNLPFWSGKLPAPSIPKFIGRTLFDRIRDLRTIETYLSAAYSNREAFDTVLMNQIRSCTEGKGGHAAFASILWSPPATKENFYQLLSQLECDVLLLFGQNDPWCKPVLAQKMFDSMISKTSRHHHRYLQLFNVGHCPNHEAPKAVAKALTTWISNEKNRSKLSFFDGKKEETFIEEWGEISMREDENVEINFLDRVTKLLI